MAACKRATSWCLERKEAETSGQVLLALHSREGGRALVMSKGHAFKKWDAIIWHDGWVKSWNGDLEKGLK
jgi:hypothetical protein